eukprot:11675-Heterococcus_DN1.PRE.2
MVSVRNKFDKTATSSLHISYKRCKLAQRAPTQSCGGNTCALREIKRATHPLVSASTVVIAIAQVSLGVGAVCARAPSDEEEEVGSGSEGEDNNDDGGGNDDSNAGSGGEDSNNNSGGSDNDDDNDDDAPPAAAVRSHHQQQQQGGDDDSGSAASGSGSEASDNDDDDDDDQPQQQGLNLASVYQDINDEEEDQDEDFGELFGRSIERLKLLYDEQAGAEQGSGSDDDDNSGGDDNVSYKYIVTLVLDGHAFMTGRGRYETIKTMMMMTKMMMMMAMTRHQRNGQKHNCQLSTVNRSNTTLVAAAAAARMPSFQYMCTDDACLTLSHNTHNWLDHSHHYSIAVDLHHEWCVYSEHVCTLISISVQFPRESKHHSVTTTTAATAAPIALVLSQA